MQEPKISAKSALVPKEDFKDSELVLGIVGAVGAESNRVIELLRDHLKLAQYQVETIKISRDVIQQYVELESHYDNEFDRVSCLMDAGNETRRKSGNHAILALGAIARIATIRQRDDRGNPQPLPRRAYIIDSLKHPDEVEKLRQVYPQGFYLIGVHSDESRRLDRLVRYKKISEEDARKLIERDANERLTFGQKVTDTFHLSDFFVHIEGHDDLLKGSLRRLIEILFGHPYRTPTFDEYAMFLAFAASLRSADLSRQVGAVIAKDRRIVATGANDCPCFDGGLYWPELDATSKETLDAPRGRDYMRGCDSNKREQSKIVKEIAETASNAMRELLDDRLGKTGRATITDAELRSCLSEVLAACRIKDITEFGRVVHAEMDALLSCARSNISTQVATIYCTTFPCHNCAKHIIAAGIHRVVYIEPYQKSKAGEFHDDSITLGFSEAKDRVTFVPFVGVGPRRFFDLFSMRLGSGWELARKDEDGNASDWSESNARLRLQMYPGSYLDLEPMAVSVFKDFVARMGDE